MFALVMKIENRTAGNTVMGEKKANNVNLLALNTPAARIPVQQHGRSKWPRPFEGLVESLCVLQGHQLELLLCFVPVLSFWLSTEKEAREEGKSSWDAHRAQKVEGEKHWVASSAVIPSCLGNSNCSPGSSYLWVHDAYTASSLGSCPIFPAPRLAHRAAFCYHQKNHAIS